MLRLIKQKLNCKKSQYCKQVLTGNVTKVLFSSSSPSSKVRSSHKFDETKLREYLFKNNVISTAENNEISFIVQQFSHGQSNPTFIINTGTQKLVMRKQPPGKLLIGAHAVDREYRVMTALKHDSKVPVPLTRMFCSDSSIIGTPFFVYDYVEGMFSSRITIAYYHTMKTIYMSTCYGYYEPIKELLSTT